jgi:peptidoglycan/LPS O-acetylase OafA/YrhL
MVIRAFPPRRAGAERRGYVPQLDGVRALAVSLVIVQHYTRHELPLATGRTGVILFFILSGFLITGILLDARQRARAAGSPAPPVLRRFYGRRFLRIFPLYYASLAVLYAAGVPEVKGYAGWHLAYLSNVLFCRLDAWPAATAHLWSLAVEEQFYLLWPLAILFAPEALLLPGMLALAAAAPAARLVLALASPNQIAPYVLPFCVFDSLGLGALLAYAWRYEVLPWRRLARLVAVLSASALAAFAALYAALRHAGWNEVVWVTASDTLTAAAMLFLVFGAAAGAAGPFARLLGARPLVYLGRISYGLYLWHLFVPPLLYRALAAAGVAQPPNGPALWIAWTALTVAVSALSWHLFERPINDLKRYLPYVPERRPPPAGEDVPGPAVAAASPPAAAP